MAQTTTYTYNAQKMLQSVIDPTGRTIVSYAYDSLGRVTGVTDSAGLTVTYTYDALGRLLRVYSPAR